MSQPVPEGMVAIVNTPTNMYCVREDLANQYIPCMACQGDGGKSYYWRVGGAILWVHGWEWGQQGFVRCKSCWGSGVAKIVTPEELPSALDPLR